jgi:dihydroneopterin aldolase/2-amino-4-hydroxy-6-hydroxymethyldihydropteridine diphosphokinase
MRPGSLDIRGVFVADQIHITALRAVTIVGALPHEREIPQPLQIDLVLDVDLHDAGASDELGDTVHYGEVADRVVHAVEEAKDVLLERLATRVADVVLAFDRVDAVDVVITKLRPPIAVDAASTAVRLTRSRADAAVPPLESHRAWIALGSNLGDRLGFLRAGVLGLPMVVAMSQVYETDPVGGPDDQGAYLNMVVEVETTLDPFALLRRCRQIEAESMRQRVVHWGPRTLDVDIVMYDDISITSDELTVPHPRFAERRFVLTPLAEIAPDRCPPDWDRTLEPAGVHPRGPLDLS